MTLNISSCHQFGGRRGLSIELVVVARETRVGVLLLGMVVTQKLMTIEDHFVDLLYH